jgi:hypothetical protein
MTTKIIEHFKMMCDWGWICNRIYDGSFIPTYRFTRTVFEIDFGYIDTFEREITLYTKPTKKGSVILLNGDIYPNDDEVIEELKRMGLK